MFLLICKLYICIQNVFGHIFYSSRLHLYWQFWQFEVQKLAYMLILAAGGSSPYLSSVTTITIMVMIRSASYSCWELVARVGTRNLFSALQAPSQVWLSSSQSCGALSLCHHDNYFAMFLCHQHYQL